MWDTNFYLADLRQNLLACGEFMAGVELNGLIEKLAFPLDESFADYVFQPPVHCSDESFEQPESVETTNQTITLVKSHLITPWEVLITSPYSASTHPRPDGSLGPAMVCVTLMALVGAFGTLTLCFQYSLATKEHRKPRARPRKLKSIDNH
jgi:hypothetical protein